MQVRGNLDGTLVNDNYKINNSATISGPLDPKTIPNALTLDYTPTDGLVATSSGANPTYRSGSPITITVTDGDQNRNTAVADTITAQVTNLATGELESVTLTETGPNTGIFTVALPTVTSATSNGNNNGTLAVAEGNQVRVTYTDPLSGNVFDSPTLPGTNVANGYTVGNTNTVTVTIDNPPVAGNDATTYVPGSPVTVSVLGNDTTGDTPVPGTVSIVGGTDTNSDGTLDRLVVLGEGTWQVNASGQIVFTPQSGFLGSPTPINYTVKDAQGNTSNQASVTVTATALADLVTVKTLVSADSTPNVGDTVQFRIRVTNSGPSTATTISLTDTLPAGLTLITVGPNAPSATAGTFTAGTGVWSILSLANGAFADLLISATVNGGTAGTTQTNTTTKATGAQLDLTDAGNDLVEAVVVNDVPVAAADTNNVTEGRTSAPSAATGNVFAGGPGADTIGANTTVNPVTQIRAGAGTPNVVVNAGTTSSNGTVVTGTYGTLTLGANGTYSYALDNTNPTVNALNNGGTLTELYTYRITDADGDFSDTTLTITINGVTDNAPSITAIDGNAGATGQVTVSEAGLTSAANTSESNTGTLSLSADNGLQTINVGGTAVPIATLNTLSTAPVTITTPKGVITLTGFTPGTTLVGGFPTTGTVNYTYTLTQVQNTPAATENTDVIALTVTDQSNFSSNGTLTVQIIDDVPVANPDTNSVAEGITTASTTTTGNVFAAGSTGDRADVIGADGAASPVTAVSTGGVLSGSPTLITAASPAVIAGTYGTLTLRADGSYSYALDNNNPAVDGLASGATLTETFTYQIKDADGDAATTQLTITINGATDPSPVITPLDGNGAANGQATVFEAGLTSAADTTETTTGGIAISAQAGIASVNIGGTSLTLAQLNALATTPVTINTPQGTLVLTGYTGNGTQGTVNYTYTLKTPVSNGIGVTEVLENIAISVTDANAVPLTANGTLSVRIVDDTPTANPDTNSVTEGITAAATATSGNVFANGGTGDTADRIGADGAANPVTRVIAGTGTPTTAVPAGAAGVNVTGTYGTLTLKSDGTYTYVLDNTNGTVDALTAGQTLTEVFTYRISDSDSDTSDTTLTITINGVTDPAPAIVAQDGNGAATGQATVFEAGLTSNADNSETTTGVLAIEAQNNIASINVGGTTVTLAQLNNLAASPITVVTPKGTLVLTGYTGNNTQGTVAYSYTLNQPQNTPGVAESTDVIALSITPGTGSPASGALTVRIVNDTPTANADTNTVTEALGTTAASTATGNVFAGGGTGDVADRIGADGATSPVTAVALGFGTPSQSVTPATPATVVGTYGTLTLRADGSYSYALNNANTTVDNLNTGETLTERFTYRIADKDGDYADTTLTITINGVNDGAPSITPVDGNGAATGQTTVFEAGLNNAADASETGTGVISLAAPAGITSVTIGGTTVTLTQLNSLSSTPITITTPKGTIVLTGYNGNTTAGNLTYSYTLSAAQNTPGAAESTDVISLVVTDAATATATGSLTVRIVDDTPTANADTNTVVEGVAATPTFAIGNVFGSGDTSDVADRIGADGATSPVTAASFGTGTPATAITPASPAVITGAYGTLTLRADGSYSYALDNTNGTVNSLSTGQTLTETFSYRIADKDGDYSDTTLTITITSVNDAPVGVNDAVTAIEAGGVLNGIAGANGAGNVLTNDTDPDSVANDETKTVSAVRLGAVEGAGTAGTVGTGLVGTYGTLTLNANGSYTYVIDNTNPLVQALRQTGQTVTESFNYSVTDAGGLSDIAVLTVTIDGRNDAPVAIDDVAAVAEASAGVPAVNATGNVLPNDTDVDTAANGETKTVAGVRTGLEAAGGALTNVAPGSNSTNGAVVVGTYGTLTLGADGSYSYAVNNNNATVNALTAGQTLTETFTYQVADAAGATDLAALTITINGTDDGVPAIVPVDGNGAATGQVTVNEAGLTSAGDTSETNTGAINLTAPDGLQSVTVGGTVVTLVQLNALAGTPITITTPKGTVTLTGFTPGTLVGGVPTAGTLAYSYTLTAAQNNNTAPAATETTDPIALVITEASGETAAGTLTVRIVDDVPTASPDTNNVAEGLTNAPSVATGNVFAGGGAGDIADRIGVDGAARPVMAVAAGNATPTTPVPAGAPAVVAGSFGTLTLNGDGSYSYALDNANATVNGLGTGQTLSEVFTYRIADSDGDFSDTTLTITINGVNDGAASIIPVDGNGGATGQTSVFEAGLGNAADTSETATGVIILTAPNGIQSVNIGGTPVTLAQLNALSTTPVTIVTPKGTLVLTGFTPVSSVGGIATQGNLSYSYTVNQAQNTPGLNESTDILALSITDATNATAAGNLTVRIADSLPTANPDTNSVTESLTVTQTFSTGNVFGAGSTGDAADSIGADNTPVNPVTQVVAGVGVPTAAVAPGTTSANGTNVTGIYGTLTLGANGSYSYALDNNNATVNGLTTGQTLTEVFTYRITDADGDTSDTTLTITINGVTDGVPSILAQDGNGGATGQATVQEAGLGNAADTSEITTGRIVVTAPDGLASVNIGGTLVPRAALANLGTTPVTIVTPKGTLVLNSFTPVSLIGGIPTQGNLDYTYTLNQAQNTPGLNENTDVFALTVTDVNSAAVTGTLTVRIVDDAPVANADRNTVNEGTANTPTTATGNIVAGGSAADVADRIGADTTANPVTGIAAGFGAPATPVAAGTPASVTGSFGTLTLAANGTYTYALDNTNATVNALRPGQTLNETFTYRITDADGDISDAMLTLTIRGANDAPVAAPDTGTTPEDTPVSGNVLSNDADPDSVLSVTQFVVNGITFAAGQTATLNGIGTLVIRADGSYTFAPAPDYSGPVPVATYTVSDGLVSTISTLTLAVTPVTDPPAVSVQNVTADAGQPSTLTLGASVTDRLLNDAGAERLTSLTLSGIPAGSLLTLANGTPVPVVNGVAALRAEDLAGLRFTPPASAVGDIKLTLSSTAQDGSAAPVTRSTDFVVSVRAIPITDGPSMTLETFNGIQNVPPRGILILQSPVADTSIFEYGDIQPDVPRLPIPFHPIVFVNNEVEASQRAREDSDARTSGGDPRVFRVGNSLPGSLGSNLGFIPNLFVQGSVRQSQEISALESTEVDGREGVIALSSDGLLNTPSVFQPQNLFTASVAPRVDLPAFAEHDAGRTTIARWEEPTPQPVPVLADRGTPRAVSPPVASAFSEQLKLAGKRLHAKPWLVADRPQKTPARAADRV